MIVLCNDRASVRAFVTRMCVLQHPRTHHVHTFASCVRPRRNPYRCANSRKCALNSRTKTPHVSRYTYKGSPEHKPFSECASFLHRQTFHYANVYVQYVRYSFNLTRARANTLLFCTEEEEEVRRRKVSGVRE